MTENKADLFHIMYNCRSMRRLKPDPVPMDLIYQILEAGIQAPIGGGVQAWRFIVVTEPELKQQIAAIYQRGWRSAEQRYEESGASLADGNMRAAAYLAEHLEPIRITRCACHVERSETSLPCNPKRDSSLCSE
ncbi:MAG: nitroreductase family protein [Terriglobia bacterium]